MGMEYGWENSSGSNKGMLRTMDMRNMGEVPLVLMWMMCSGFNASLLHSLQVIIGAISCRRPRQFSAFRGASLYD
jgi:hypothetical protein